MQSPGRSADPLAQPRLDVHVNVFERLRERERAAFDLGQHLIEPGGDRSSVLGRDHTLLRQHRRMGLAAGDILSREALVEIDRGVDGLQNVIGL